MPVHQLLRLPWSDFLTEAVCLLQHEEDFRWELESGIGQKGIQKTLDIRDFSNLSGLV
jgi:hypothetical protein